MNELIIAMTSGGVITFLFTFLITWGTAQSRSKEIERRTALLEANVREVYTLVHGLREVYVTYQHFNEIMATVREQNSRMDSKIERILELLAARV